MEGDGATRFGRRQYLVLLAAVGVVPVLVAATASGGRTFFHAANPACGATVTTSVTLTANMDCSGSPSDGIDVGANSVTINLNGHSITGDNADFGIIDNGFHGVVIENGTIDAFGSDGVYISLGASSSRVSGMRVEGNSGNGIEDLGLNGTVITGNYVLDNTDDGILALGNDGVQVTTNLSEGNGSDGIAVASVTAPGAVVTGNKALNNATDGIFIDNVTGTLSGNTANANSSDGIVAEGIPLTVTPGFVVTGNRASFNTGLGFSTIGAKDGGGNVVQQNGNAQQCNYIVCAAVSS